MTKNIFYALLLFLCPAIYGQYDGFDATINRKERIINFHSDIIIDTTGVIRVTETIQLYAGGNDIQRGIVRSIPLYRIDKYDKKIKIETDVISVSRDGREEDYRIENTRDNKEIYIGNADIFFGRGRLRIYHHLRKPRTNRFF